MTKTAALPAAPLRFQPSMEHPEEDESQTIRQLDETLLKVRETTFEHSGHATRSVHAKGHGLLDGTLTVAEGLPPQLAQGLFATPGEYKVVMRFSTIPGDILQDNVSTPRGLAVKVIGVTGDRLPGSEGVSTQDFVLVNAPAFSAPTAKKFSGILKLVAATTDKVEGLKHAVSHITRLTESIIEAFGGKSAAVVTLGGQPAVHILGDTFYSQTPFLFGDAVAKFSIAPVSPGLTALIGKKVDIESEPNALRQHIRDHFAHDGGEWELRVQLCTDLDKMPIEDASVAWPEDLSPYVAVGRIACPPQNSWSSDNQARVEEGLSFSPWHGLSAHRPLGGVNRARKETYQHSASFRGERNGCPMHEPR